MKLKQLFLVGAVILAATSAMAQGMRGGMGGGMQNPVMLLGREDVKTDLALTDDQKNKIAEIRDGMRSDFQAAFQAAGDDQAARQKAMADLMKTVGDKVNAILTADQQKRLKEISYQLGGYGAIAGDKALQTSLGLTDDQKTKLASLSTGAQEANQAIFQKMRSQEIDQEAARASMTKNQDALKAGVEALLTADQKTKFKDMQGKPFANTTPPTFGGRGGG